MIWLRFKERWQTNKLLKKSKNLCAIVVCPCSRQCLEADVLFNLNNCFELSNDELDLVILASIQAFTHCESSGTKPKRSPRCSFYYQSVPICKEMFLIFYGLSDARFRRLKEHYQNHGVSLRTHGNMKRLPHNTLSQATVEGVKAFLSNYVEENAICLPGRIRGFKSDEIHTYIHTYIHILFNKAG